SLRAGAALACPRVDREGSRCRGGLRPRGLGVRRTGVGPFGARLRMSALRVERDRGLLRIALARPERRNAFDAALIEELAGAFADVGDVRAVLLTGDGPSFS